VFELLASQGNDLVGEASMSARIMWGSTGDDPVLIDADAVERADDVDFTFLGRGESSSSTGPATVEEGAIPADRVLFIVDDDVGPQPIAVASEHVAGNADVLAAVEQEWKARTGRTDVRPDAVAEPPATQPSPEAQ
jgi:hypothetical protein